MKISNKLQNVASKNQNVKNTAVQQQSAKGLSKTNQSYNISDSLSLLNSFGFQSGSAGSALYQAVSKGKGNAYGLHGQNNSLALLLQLLLNACQQKPPVYQPPVNEPPVYQPPVYQPPVNEPPVYQPPVNEPPVYQPPQEPPVYQPPVQPPVCPPEDKVRGSAGMFGDPMFGLFTPNLGNVPAALKAFDSGLQNGQVVDLLSDSDGAFNVKAEGIQVNSEVVNSTGIGKLTFSAGSNAVQLRNDGSVLVNGQVRGNIKDNGLISPIALGNGLTLSTSMEVDDAAGNRSERFVITNGEYKFTAALRSPHENSQNYFDLNAEELTANAADNATGFQANVPGLNKLMGLADLLRIEPGTL